MRTVLRKYHTKALIYVEGSGVASCFWEGRPLRRPVWIFDFREDYYFS